MDFYRAAELAAVWIGVVVTVYVNARDRARVSGERDQRIADLEKSDSEKKKWLLMHDSRLNEHDMELAESRGFRKGFEAAQPK